MATISSSSNSSIKNLLRLKKAGDRKKLGLFMVDGRREIELALSAGQGIVSLFYSPDLIKGQQELISAVRSKQGEIIEVTKNIFQKICYKENPDGFLAVVKLQEKKLADIKLNKNPLLVILERVEKPGNLGAILRTAYAVNATAVIINDNQTDIYNPNVIRASEGTIFSQTVLKASVSETLEWLRAHKISSFAAATSGSQEYISVDLSGPAAFVFGSEASGLSREWLEGAEQAIKIPMRHGLDSLNVSVSAAVILFESIRQRNR